VEFCSMLALLLFAVAAFEADDVAPAEGLLVALAAVVLFGVVVPEPLFAEA